MPTRAAAGSKRKRDSSEDEVGAEVTASPRTRKRNKKRSRRANREKAELPDQVGSQSEAEDDHAGPAETTLPEFKDKGKRRAKDWGSSPPAAVAEAPSTTSTGVSPSTAVDADVPPPPAAASSPNTADELAKLKQELELKEALLRNHEAFAKQILQHASCHICMELAEDPLTLTCGHSFCKNCLWECFNRPVAEDESVPEDEEQYATADEGDREPQPSDRPANLNTEDSTAGPREPGSSSHIESEGARVGTSSTAAQAHNASNAAPTANSGPDHITVEVIVENTIRLNAQRRQNLFCPSCRCRIYEPPFPVFGLRDLTHTVSEALTRPGGVLYDPANYTSQSSTKPAPKLTADWNGLFAQSTDKRRNKGFRDEEDRVMRCLHCNWEIRDGFCGSCGAEYSEDEEAFGGLRESRHGATAHGAFLESDGDSLDEQEEDEEDTGEMDDFIETDDDISHLTRMARRHHQRSNPRRPVRPARIIDSEEDEEEDSDAGSDEGSDGIEDSDDDGEDSSDERGEDGDDSFVRRSLVNDSSTVHRDDDKDSEEEEEGSENEETTRAIVEEDNDDDDLSGSQEVEAELRSPPMRRPNNNTARRSYPPPIIDHDAQASDTESESSDEAEDAEEESPGPVARRRAPRIESDSDHSPVRREATNRRGDRLVAEVSNEGLAGADHLSPSSRRMMDMFKARARMMAQEHEEEGSEGGEEEDQSGDEDGEDRFVELIDDQAEVSDDEDEDEEE